MSDIKLTSIMYIYQGRIQDFMLGGGGGGACCGPLQTIKRSAVRYP